MVGISLPYKAAPNSLLFREEAPSKNGYVVPHINEPDGTCNQLVQWQATGCHLALLFDAQGKFPAIKHQYANYRPAPARPEGNDELASVTIKIIIIAIIAMIWYTIHKM